MLGSKRKCTISPPSFYEGRKCKIKTYDEYRLDRDLKGNSVYTSMGTVNIIDDIQSYAKLCSLNQLLNRIQHLDARDKISYLQQTEQGVSADLRNMPSDLVEAHIMLKQFKNRFPDFSERLKKGESFDSIVSSMMKKNTTPSEPDNSYSNKTDIKNGGDLNGKN